MKTFLLLSFLLFPFSTFAEGSSIPSPVLTTPTGIPVNTPWKQKVYEFARQYVVHPSWGFSHSERDYHMTLQLAKLSNFAVDEEVLYVTAFLHDVGGLPPFFKEDVDHAVRSVEVIEPLLPTWGFPMNKWPQVKEMILGHTYYGPVPTSKPAQAFHDADVLDFLGAIGIARIMAVTEEDAHMNSTLKPGVATLKSFAKSMAGKCALDSCKDLAKPRQAELDAFLKSIEEQSLSFKAL